MNHPMDYLHHASFGIGVLGVLVIVFGVICGVGRFVRSEFRAARGSNVDQDRKHLRHLLGYYLLLGLEFLIAADIIDTLMKPSVQDLIVLGAIIVIRTIISFSLNAELKSEKQTLSTSPTLVGTSRCDVPYRETAGGTFASLNAPQTAQRAVPTLASP
jgi:uncharacterized membrane protein